MVDLDRSSIYLKNQAEDLPELFPESSRNGIMSRLSQFSNIYKPGNMTLSDDVITSFETPIPEDVQKERRFQQNDIRAEFLSIFVSSLQGYFEFVNPAYFRALQDPDIPLFATSDFLHSVPDSQHVGPFLKLSQF